jgi:hypothetical protein
VSVFRDLAGGKGFVRIKYKAGPRRQVGSCAMNPALVQSLEASLRSNQTRLRIQSELRGAVFAGEVKQAIQCARLPVD